MLNYKTYFWKPFVQATVINITVIIISLFLFPKWDLMNILIITLVFSIKFYLPFLILVTNYVFNDSKLDLKKNSQFLELQYKEVRRQVYKKDILRLEIYESIPRSQDRFSFFFWDRLFYYKLVLSDGSSFLISCFSCDDLENFCSSIKVKKIGKFFPLLSAV